MARWPRWTFAALLALAAAPPAQALDRYDLVDPIGDVRYDDLYSGPQDRDHVDVVGASMSLDEAGGFVVITLEVRDGRRLVPDDREFGQFFTVEAFVYRDEEVVGVLHAHGGRSPDPIGRLVQPGWEWYSSAGFFHRGPVDDDGTWVAEETLAHAFDKDLGVPGTFRYFVDLEGTRGYGNELRNLRAWVQEDYLPLGYGMTITNTDYGDSTSRLSLTARTAASELVAEMAGSSASAWAVATIVTLAVLAGAKGFLGWGGYAKLRAPDITNHPARADLLRLVAMEPGVTRSQLASRTGARWSTLIYHLDVLERNGLLVSLREGRHRRFIRPGALPPSQILQLAALQNEKSRQAYEVLREHPDLDRREVASRIGAPPTTIVWHLERLSRAKLVERVRLGRRVLYRAAPSPALE